MAKYKKCPRCELNYIKEDEDYCDVCKSEMVHHSDDEEDFLDIEDLEICPVCGQNYIRENQTMCDECRGKSKEELPDSASWDDGSDSDDIVSIDDRDSEQDDDYNEGYGDIDPTEDADDGFEVLGEEDETIDFSADEEPEEEVEEENETDDGFEALDEDGLEDIEDDEEDEEDEDDFDFKDDFIGKSK